MPSHSPYSFRQRPRQSPRFVSHVALHGLQQRIDFAHDESTGRRTRIASGRIGRSNNPQPKMPKGNPYHRCNDRSLIERFLQEKQDYPHHTGTLARLGRSLEIPDGAVSLDGKKTWNFIRTANTNKINIKFLANLQIVINNHC